MKNQKGFTLAELLFVILFVILFLAVVGGGGYMLVHFISKFW